MLNNIKSLLNSFKVKYRCALNNHKIALMILYKLCLRLYKKVSNFESTTI